MGFNPWENRLTTVEQRLLPAPRVAAGASRPGELISIPVPAPCRLRSISPSSGVGSRAWRRLQPNGLVPVSDKPTIRGLAAGPERTRALGEVYSAFPGDRRHSSAP